MQSGVQRVEEQLQKARVEFPYLVIIPYGCEISFGLNRSYRIILPNKYPEVPPMITKGSDRVTLPILSTWNPYIQLVHVIRQLKTEVTKMDPTFCKQYSVPPHLITLLQSQNPMLLSDDDKRRQIIESHPEIAEMLSHRAGISSERKSIREEVSELQKQYESDVNEIISLQDNISEMQMILNSHSSDDRMKESMSRTIESLASQISEAKQSLEDLKDRFGGELSLDDYVAESLELRQQIYQKEQLRDHIIRKLHSM